MRALDGAPSAPPSAAAPKPRSCTVRYALNGTSAGRASARVTILNTSDVAVPAWRLSFALPAGQRVAKGWSATWKQEGPTVVAAGGRLPARGTVATGFSTAYGTVAALPVTFRLNGTECLAEMSVQAPPPAQATGNSTTKSTQQRQPVAGPAQGSAAKKPAADPGPGSKNKNHGKSSSKSKGKGKSK